ncbi:MAG TPA: hypothetical protein VKB78_13225 [Pirellulales bacterium]|nr:hypothetical protein [Pirellulales bacterium]
MFNLKIRLSKTLMLTSVCGLSFLAAGCTQSQRATLMGEGFNDEFSKTGQSLRPQSGSSEHLDGLSTKSQQIERDLRVD